MANKKGWGWVFDPSYTPPPKITPDFKRDVLKTFEDLLETLKNNSIKPETPENDELSIKSSMNYPVGIRFKMLKHFIYVIATYRSMHPNRISDYYDYNIARIECFSTTLFKLCYFRHTGKWTEYYSIQCETAETIKKEILENPLFDI